MRTMRANVVAALLCANHVNRTFGKGVMPRRYRLRGADVRAHAESILGAVRALGPVVRPPAVRGSSAASGRDDREDRRVLLGRRPG